jgi:DNA-binding response OmpR family regulator
MKILIVDDDADLLALVGFALTQAGFTTVKAADVPSAIQTFTAEGPDLAILDINLPRGSGFDICEAIRRQSRIPIMMLTARGEEEDLVKALDLGADDYLTKPFSPRTLLARVRALLRRAGLEAGGAMTAGALSLDLEAHTLCVGTAAAVKLTKLETRLLQILMANDGHVVSTERLLTHVWGHRGSGDRQLLKQLVHRLRQKIEADPAAPAYLQTEAGAGYRLEVKGGASVPPLEAQQ